MSDAGSRAFSTAHKEYPWSHKGPGQHAEDIFEAMTAARSESDCPQGARLCAAAQALVGSASHHFAEGVVRVDAGRLNELRRALDDQRERVVATDEALTQAEAVLSSLGVEHYMPEAMVWRTTGLTVGQIRQALARVRTARSLAEAQAAPLFRPRPAGHATASQRREDPATAAPRGCEAGTGEDWR